MPRPASAASRDHRRSTPTARSSPRRTHSAAPQRKIAEAPRPRRAMRRCDQSRRSSGRSGPPDPPCGRKKPCYIIRQIVRRMRNSGGAIPMAHDHDHDHDHGSELSETQLRVRALETVLAEKGYLDPAALDAIIEAYETKIGPHVGARVIAKAWLDPEFKKALLADATKAIGTLGHISRVGDHLVAIENTPKTHNMVVCTLCSCYPWEMLGLPPVWYKAAPYRSRAVKDPRGVLSDFGVTLPKDMEIRVWDSTAETRFIVVPMRPAGTEGWNEDQLTEIVTRDSMIGTGLPEAKRPA